MTRWDRWIGHRAINVRVEDDGSITLDVNDSFYSCTMTREQAIEMAKAVLIEVRMPLGNEIAEARKKAHDKHGENSIENIAPNDPRWLPILGEEYGEVCGTLTYDKNHDNLRGELVDVITVAAAWVDAIDGITNFSISNDNISNDNTTTRESQDIVIDGG